MQLAYQNHRALSQFRDAAQLRVSRSSFGAQIGFVVRPMLLQRETQRPKQAKCVSDTIEEGKGEVV